MSIEQKTIDTVIAEIHKYKPKLTVTKADVVAKEPDYPFVSIALPNNIQRIGGTHKFPWKKVDLTLTDVSNDQDEALSLGDWLQNILLLAQPLQDLKQRGMIPQNNVSSVPNVRSFIQNSFEFNSGAKYTIAVYDPIIDDTQPGYFDHVQGTVNGAEDDIYRKGD